MKFSPILSLVATLLFYWPSHGTLATDIQFEKSKNVYSSFEYERYLSEVIIDLRQDPFSDSVELNSEEIKMLADQIVGDSNLLGAITEVNPRKGSFKAEFRVNYFVLQFLDVLEDQDICEFRKPPYVYDCKISKNNFDLKLMAEALKQLQVDKKVKHVSFTFKPLW